MKDRELSREGFAELIAGLLKGTPMEDNEEESAKFLELSSAREMYLVARLFNSGRVTTVEEAQRWLRQGSEALERRKAFRIVVDGEDSLERIGRQHDGRDSGS